MTSPEVRRRIVVVGAGAAGQLAALAAAQGGAAVTLLEQMPQPGLKLLATGGGRCNLTHQASAEAIVRAFGRQGRFGQTALTRMNPQALRTFFERLGVPTQVEDGDRVFPRSRRAADVQGALDRRLAALGVSRRLGWQAAALCFEGQAVRGVRSATDEYVPAEAVILATGGKSYPGLGGTGGGYALAIQAGHTIVEPTPALVGLVAKEPWLEHWAGVSLPAAAVRIALPRQSKAGVAGEVLFTHRGLTGPAVLDLSGDVADLLTRRDSVPLALRWTDRSQEQWREQLEQWRTSDGRKTLPRLLREALPARVVRQLLTMAEIDQDCPAAHVPGPAREKIIGLLAELPLTVVGTEGFAKAMVTRGGVTLSEVDPQTLQSRRRTGLYFAGELLDLDGPTGGYNLHWAFASGFLAGESAAGRTSASKSPFS